MNKERDAAAVPGAAPDSLERRDFLQGAAFTMGALLASEHVLAGPESGPDASAEEPLLAANITQQDPRYYPPALTGMRGSHPGSFEVAHTLRDAGRWTGDAGIDTGERYDLVVVGAGNSGLAAAYAYQRKRGKNAKILVLDNHDDIGGHAKRNEFKSGGKTLIGYGGTQSIVSSYPAETIGVLSEIGIELRRFDKYWDRDFRKRHGLQTGVFFDKETFGADHLARGLNERPILEVLANAPMAPQAKQDMHRLFEKKVDYLQGMSFQEKHAYLARTSFAKFLTDRAKVHPDVVKYFDSFPCEITGLSADASSAIVSLTEGTWFPTYPDFDSSTWNLVEGMALGCVPRDHYGYICHFPDGNASVARLLARAINPQALPGSSMEDVVTARMDYGQLDSPQANARVRLNSTVVNVKHLGAPEKSEGVEVTYVLGGKVYRVRGAGVVMACYNMMIPRICPELPQAQKEALLYPKKVALVYTNVQVRNWRAIKKLGIDHVYCPGSFFYSITMDFPVSMGDYAYTRSPADPVVLHLATHIPSPRDLPPRQRCDMTRVFLYTTPFSTFEAKIKEQLNRVFGGGGFDAERDIEAITVNRWPHGYADSLEGLDDPVWKPGEAPNIVGRQRFGRITIANSDAGADAETGAAIEQALRAVSELPI